MALAASFALLAFGTVRAAAVPAAGATATNDCWKKVVNDWLGNNQVDGTYAIPCYTQAIQHLNAYPDVQNYSSAIDDIHNALLAAIRQDRGSGGGGSTGGGGSSPSGPSSSGPTPNGPSGNPTPSSGPKNGGFLHSLTPSNAQSIPLPLIVLAVLALLLIAAAAATWFTRRLQARRVVPPRPAPAPAVDKRR